MKRVQYVFVFFFVIVVAGWVKAQTVEVRISNLINNRGTVNIGIFKDQGSFDKEKPFEQKVFSKQSVKNGNLTVKFHLPVGTYGLALLDDEDNDGQMRYNFLGIPREGFGFSNYESSGMTKPKFSDFSFRVSKGNNIVNVKIRYIF